MTNEDLVNRNRKIRIIVTDDHAIYRAGVIKAISGKAGIEIIAEAGNGKDLLDKLEYLRPEMVIMGIQMPVMDGITALPILKQRYPELKIIMLTMMDDASMIKKAITLGANAYLTKTTSSEILYEAIVYCRDNWLYINNTLLDALVKKRSDETSGKGGFNGTELRIMKLFCDGKTVQEIADEFDFSPRTVSAIIDKLLTKAKATNARELTRYAAANQLL